MQIQQTFRTEESEGIFLPFDIGRIQSDKNNNVIGGVGTPLNGDENSPLGVQIVSGLPQQHIDTALISIEYTENPHFCKKARNSWSLLQNKPDSAFTM